MLVAQFKHSMHSHSLDYIYPISVRLTITPSRTNQYILCDALSYM